MANGSTVTRADDERVLQALRLRGRGWSTPQIAQRMGYPSDSAVRTILNRVARDLAKSESA
jgi:hypothetical protein